MTDFGVLLNVVNSETIESTTIALLLRLSSLLEPLRAFSATKPIWGTCAGAILLAKEIANPKKGGQEVLGQVSVRIERNGWGSQVRLRRLSFPLVVC